MYTNDVRHTYKDSLFRLIFREKKDLLALYNAINGSAYENPEDLEITTLGNVIYMGTKNDVSFMIEDRLNLWEHQSSFNPNMPIRGLFYFARLYREYVEVNRINLFSSRLKKLPLPVYIVFYNGLKQEPDRLELRLSDAFIRPSHKESDVPEPCLELKAVMLNINYGQNRELMEQCGRLKEYAQFIECIRQMQKECQDTEEAVNRAIHACITRGILKDVLTVHRREVVSMFLTEYNREAHMEMEREEWHEEGRREGIQEGRKEGIQEGRKEGVEEGIQKTKLAFKRAAEGHSISEIADELSLSEDAVREILS